MGKHQRSKRWKRLQLRISNNFNVYLHLGISIKLIPMFGPNDLGKLIKDNKPNHIMTVPSTLEAMKIEPSLQNEDLSFLKNIGEFSS